MALEDKVYSRLKDITESVRKNPWSRKIAHRVWFTELVVDANGVVKAVDGVKGKLVPGDVQIDAIRVTPGYVPKVGEKLDLSKVHDVYDIKTNLYGSIGVDQREKLKKLINAGDPKGPRSVKGVNSPRKQQGRYAVIDNPKYTGSLKIYTGLLTALGLVTTTAGSVHAMIYPQDHEAELEVVFEAARKAINQKDDQEKRLDTIRFVDLFINYLKNFAIPGVDYNIVRYLAIQWIMGTDPKKP